MRFVVAAIAGWVRQPMQADAVDQSESQTTGGSP